MARSRTYALRQYDVKSSFLPVLFNLNVAKFKKMPKLMSEGICMCFNKAIVSSMFKHVASENGASFNTAKLFSNFHCKAH